MKFAICLVSGLVRRLSFGKTHQGLDVANFDLIVPRIVNEKRYINRFRVSAFGEGVKELKSLGAEDGRTLFLLGRLQTEEWEDQDGNRRRAVKIVFIKGWTVEPVDRWELHS